jgi:hypothetical protein
MKIKVRKLLGCSGRGLVLVNEKVRNRGDQGGINQPHGVWTEPRTDSQPSHGTPPSKIFLKRAKSRFCERRCTLVILR